MSKDPFDRFGLPETASEEQIKMVYKKKAQKMHPDRVGDDPVKMADFLQLQEDYALLRNPETRNLILSKRNKDRLSKPDLKTSKEFEKKLKEKEKENKQKQPKPNKEVDSNNGNVLFSDLKMLVEIPVSLAWSGGSVDIAANRYAPCGCKGLAPNCPGCNGTGKAFTVQNLKIDIPLGCLPGQQIVIPGRGNRGINGVGDLIIIVNWLANQEWKWDGKKLNMHITVPVWKFKPGQIITIYSPSGTKGEIKFPNVDITDKRSVTISVPGLGLKTDPKDKRPPVNVTINKATLVNFWKGAGKQKLFG